jgi:DNA repair exonuclease SbcCD ATPase subunit
MAINLKTLQPHKVSRDLSGYITYIYGPGGSGKTTFGSRTEKPLLLASNKK